MTDCRNGLGGAELDALAFHEAHEPTKSTLTLGLIYSLSILILNQSLVVMSWSFFLVHVHSLAYI